MTWLPPERPEWVRSINAGAIPPITSEASRPLNRDVLLHEARVLQGIGDSGVEHDFGGADFIEPLDIIVDDLEHEAELSVIGRWATRRYLLRLLQVRIQIANWVRADPDVVTEPLDNLVVVSGAPRTGTSILHALLAQDTASRVPLGWELLRPVPPPSPTSTEDGDPGHDDPRIAVTEAELRLPTSIVEGLESIHVYGALMPKECLSAMSFAFRSEEFVARYHVPNYQRWLEGCDMVPAYRAHRLVLQILQRRSPKRRWVVKSPVHLQSLPALRTVYPDAQLIVTHRDPMAVLASVTSLIATLRWAHSDSVDFPAIASYHAALYHRSLSGLSDADTAAAAGDAHHVRYSDFIRAQIPTVAATYERLGWEFDASTERAMTEYLAGRPKDKHGVHAYSFDDLGLDLDAERARFQPYMHAFGVVPEPTR